MLSLLRRQIACQVPRNARCLSEAAAEASASSSATMATTPPSPAAKPSPSSAKSTQQYFIPRNTKGNLPVYSEVRNAGGRYLVLIRNVEGSLMALAKDLSKSLFEPGTYEASKLKVELKHSKHVVISGGQWKERVTLWLKNKGF